MIFKLKICFMLKEHKSSLDYIDNYDKAKVNYSVTTMNGQHTDVYTQSPLLRLRGYDFMNDDAFESEDDGDGVFEYFTASDPWVKLFLHMFTTFDDECHEIISTLFERFKITLENKFEHIEMKWVKTQSEFVQQIRYVCTNVRILYSDLRKLITNFINTDEYAQRHAKYIAGYPYNIKIKPKLLPIESEPNDTHDAWTYKARCSEFNGIEPNAIVITLAKHWFIVPTQYDKHTIHNPVNYLVQYIKTTKRLTPKSSETDDT